MPIRNVILYKIAPIPQSLWQCKRNSKQNTRMKIPYEGDNLQNSSSSFQLGNNLIRLILTTKCKQIIIA